MDLQSIILKILNKNQAHEELEQLKAWKSETAENLKLYQEINGIVEEGAQLASHKDFDVDAGYAKFRIQTKKSKDSNNWISALILLALLVATYFAYEQFNKEDLSPKIYIAETSNSTVSLKDGSIIHLNKGATLAEKSDFITSRLVDLEGEAFFEIERNESLPFKIFLKDDVFVEVLGTSFNIINEEEQIEVSVESGKVAFNAFGRKNYFKPGRCNQKNRWGFC